MKRLKARFMAHPVGTSIEFACILIMIGYNLFALTFNAYNYRMSQMTMGMCFVAFGITEFIINPKKNSKLLSLLFILMGIIDCVLAIFPH
ncbi:hypothetical protein [Atopobium fossor]|uniref:hypothetical protein n=1 Tax=Atopobium fossor TaxID=39487 RepID=UPI00040F9620|nr:hypothetical protein [Atopobium fossor]